MQTSQYIIHERSNRIAIPKNLSTTMKGFSEYSLKQNFFDPSKSSPPNEFMIKLHMRMSIYNHSSEIKDDSFDNE